MKNHDIQYKLDLHTAWRNSGGQVGEQAVFANCDLGGFDFTGMDLSLIIFDYANLSHANFLGAEIRECSFYRAILSGCKNMLIWQAPKQAGRICYSVNHKHFAKHKLGCFWGDTAEAISQIKEKYGANSLYEEALIMYSRAVMKSN